MRAERLRSRPPGGPEAPSGGGPATATGRRSAGAAAAGGTDRWDVLITRRLTRDLAHPGNNAANADNHSDAAEDER